jgi:hypothetical protein
MNRPFVGRACIVPIAIFGRHRDGAREPFESEDGWT